MKYNNDTFYGAVATTLDAVLLASAARTATPAAADLTNFGARGIRVVLDITVDTGGLGSVTVAINGKDPASGKYYNLLTSASKSAVATTVLVVYPTITASANLIAQDVLPQTFQITVTHGDANPLTYSVGYSLLP